MHLIDRETLADLRNAVQSGVAGADLALQAAELANSGNEGADSAGRLLATLEGSCDVAILFLGFQYFFRVGDLNAAERWARRRVQVVEAAELEPVRARAHTNLGLVLLAKRESDAGQEAFVHLEKAVGISTRLNDPAGLSRDLGNLANAYEAAGDVAAAIALNLRGLALAREVGSDSLALTKLANLGDLMLQQSNPVAAREFYSKAVALMRSTGHSKHLDEYATKLAKLDLHDGNS